MTKRGMSKQRNGYFHKHNLHSIEKVEEIRTKAIYLYFLILGSCTIEDDQFARLGIITGTEDNDFSYDLFVSWLENILNYGLPRDTVAVSLTLYDTRGNTWSIQLHGLKTFDENIPFYEWKDNFNSEHNSYTWRSNLPGKKVVYLVSNAVNEYLTKGRCKEKLSTYQAVAVACRHHTEFPYMRTVHK